MTQRDEASKKLQITAICVEDAAKVLSAAYRRRIDVQQVQAIVDAAQILRADGTFSLIDYTAYLAGEVTGVREN